MSFIQKLLALNSRRGSLRNAPYCRAGRSPDVAALSPFAVLASPIHVSELRSQLKRLKDKSGPQPREFTECTLYEGRACAASVWKAAPFSSLAPPSGPGRLTVMLADCPGTAPLCSQTKFLQILINVHSIFGPTWCHTSFHKYYKHTQPHPMPQEPTS